MAFYRDKKTGRLYCSQGIVINATNAADAQAMVLYADDCGHLFCRELGEFHEKFERIHGDDSAENGG
jgi:hypothetical protein